MSTISLTIPAKPEYLVFGRLVLTGLSRTVEIDPETLSDLKLAVTEACSNSVRHAYDESAEGAVNVRYELGPESLVIEVLDDGRGFPPGESPGAVADLSDSGMGLAIIRAVVDELELGPKPDGRGVRLRFRKRLP